MTQRQIVLLSMQQTWVPSLGWEDPLEEGMATHRSIPAWSIPWTEEPGGLLSLQSQRVRQDQALGSGGSTAAGTQHRHETQVINAATPPPQSSSCLRHLVICVWRALGGNAAAWAGVKEPSRAVGSWHGAGLVWDGGPPGLLAHVSGGALLSVVGSFDHSCAGHSPAAVGTGGTQARGLQQLPGTRSRLRALRSEIFKS